MSLTSTQARSKHVDPFESGTLESWGGLVSGTVQAYAEEIGVHPEAVVKAADRVPLLVDTAEQKGQGTDYERPEDPAKRCLALTAEHAKTLAELAKEI